MELVSKFKPFEWVSPHEMKSIKGQRSIKNEGPCKLLKCLLSLKSIKQNYEYVSTEIFFVLLYFILLSVIFSILYIDITIDI